MGCGVCLVSVDLTYDQIEMSTISSLLEVIHSHIAELQRKDMYNIITGGIFVEVFWVSVKHRYFRIRRL
jgi:hypothetical protein